VIFQSFLLRFGRRFRRFTRQKKLQRCFIIEKRTTLSFYCRRVIDKLFHHYLVTEFFSERVPIVIWLFAEVCCHQLATVFVFDGGKQEHIWKKKLELEGFDVILNYYCPRFSSRLRLVFVF